MSWPASLFIACWPIWAFPSPRPFAGRADGSTTWPPLENPLHPRDIGRTNTGFQCREPKVLGADIPRTCPGGDGYASPHASSHVSSQAKEDFQRCNLKLMA